MSGAKEKVFRGLFWVLRQMLQLFLGAVFFLFLYGCCLAFPDLVRVLSYAAGTVKKAAVQGWYEGSR